MIMGQIAQTAEPVAETTEQSERDPNAIEREGIAEASGRKAAKARAKGDPFRAHREASWFVRWVNKQPRLEQQTLRDIWRETYRTKEGTGE